ncbi:helix-turn-helix domain-containing protein, partial [Serratia marcescens]|uniref:helix-turn-helix domain-containing protein n=1 Tax=Serratia marcescens TaxID=615 RepID=UPI0034E2E84B
LIAERRTAGIKRAQSEGVYCGRPIKATAEQIQELIRQGRSPKQVQDELQISKATFYRLNK